MLLKLWQTQEEVIMQNKLKFGIIGVGNMGTAHAKHLFESKIEGAVLTAICDTDIRVRERLSAQFIGIKVYKNHIDLLKNSDVDCVIIATPHYAHPNIAVDCFKAGKNVLTEKPIGVLQTEIEKMISAAKESGKVFGIMFNQRTNSLFKAAREFVKSGKLGEKKRLVWQITNWYRTQSYYNSSSWRATYSGEGGGVLMNQAPHQLDLLQWIFGLPKSVFANLKIAKYHDIEVEDDAELLFNYSDGSSAVFVTSTGESPGTNRLEISGSKGKIVLEEGRLKFFKLEQDERDFCFEKQEGFYDAPYSCEEICEENELHGHIAILQNFCNHILNGEELIASGFDGVYQSKMTAAAYLSHFKGKKIDLDFKSAEFDKELKKRCKKTTKTVVNLDKNEPHQQRWQVRW